MASSPLLRAESEDLAPDRLDEDDDFAIVNVKFGPSPERIQSEYDDNGVRVKRETREHDGTSGDDGRQGGRQPLFRGRAATVAAAGLPMTPTKAMRNMTIEPDRSADDSLWAGLKRLPSNGDGLGGGHIGFAQPSSVGSGSTRRQGDGEDGGSPSKRVKKEMTEGSRLGEGTSSPTKSAEDLERERKEAAQRAELMETKESLLEQERRNKDRILRMMEDLEAELITLPDQLKRDEAKADLILERASKKAEKAKQDATSRMEARRDEIVQENERLKAELKKCGKNIRFIRTGAVAVASSAASAVGTVAGSSSSQSLRSGGDDPFQSTPLPSSADDSNGHDAIEIDDDDGNDDDPSTWRCAPKREPAPSEPPVGARRPRPTASQRREAPVAGDSEDEIDGDLHFEDDD